MLYLLDANVLIAMAWPNHPFHSHARTWFLQHAATGWATCGLTETAFIRLSANPIVVGQAPRPPEAWRLLCDFRRYGAHQFLSDDRLDNGRWERVLNRCIGHKQVNDAWLVALAGSHDATLVTYDRPIQVLAEQPADVLVLMV